MPALVLLLLAVLPCAQAWGGATLQVHAHGAADAAASVHVHVHLPLHETLHASPPHGHTHGHTHAAPAPSVPEPNAPVPDGLRIEVPVLAAAHARTFSAEAATAPLAGAQFGELARGTAPPSALHGAPRPRRGPSRARRRGGIATLLRSSHAILI